MPDKPVHFRICRFFLILAAAGLYLLGNGRVALWDRDEPRYAMASRWMASSGDWVVPRMGWGLDPQTPRTAKPPLVYWCQATAMKIFGTTVFAARLPSSVAMICTLILLACVLGKYFPEHAFWTLLVFATSVLTIVAAKMCVIDSVQLLWIVICEICCYAMWRGYFTWPVALAFGIAVGLAELAKGPVVLGVLVSIVIVLWILRFFSTNKKWGVTLYECRRQRVGRKILLLMAINAAIIVPWLLSVAHRAPGFLPRMVGHDLIQRMHEPLEGHKGPPGFYLLTIFGTFYPWSLFLPLAIGNAWRHRDEPAIRFALAAVIGPWIMFECISTKMVHYVLPIFPPLAFLLADALLRHLRRISTPSPGIPGEGGGEGLRIESPHHSVIESFEAPNPNPLPAYRARGPEKFDAIIPKWAICIWAIVTTAITTAMLLPDRWFLQTPLWPGILMVLAGLIYAIAVLSLFWKARIRAALLVMGIGFGALATLLFAFYLPTASFLRISPNLARALNQNHAADARMIGYEEQSLAFYDAGRIDSLPGSTLHQPISAWPMYLVITWDVYQHLPQEIKTHYAVVGETTGINYSKSIRPITVMVLTRSPHYVPYVSMPAGYWLMPYPPPSVMDSISGRP